MERTLSDKYKNQIRQININGVSGFAWRRDVLLDFLKSDESDYFAILGGDVLRIVGDKMEYTYDNWCLDGKRKPSESFPSYVARCKERTIQYISAYPSRDDIVFSLVMSSEVTAGL